MRALAFLCALLMTCGSQSPVDEGEVWGWICPILFLAPMILAALWLEFHERIEADERGLTFYGFFKTKFVSWPEIEDYELRASKMEPPLSAYLKINEKWQPLLTAYSGSKSHSGYNALLATIEREARWSQSRTWRRNGLPPQAAPTEMKWPQTFSYSAGPRHPTLWFALMLILTSVAFAHWGNVVDAAMVAGAACLVFAVRRSEWKAQLPYLGEKIVAMEEGVLHTKNGTEIFVRWDEISDYFIEQRPGTFQLNVGVILGIQSRIEFLLCIKKAGQLQALVHSKAVNAATTRWKYPDDFDETVIGGQSSFWEGGKVGEGHKTHHYRTVWVRMILFGGPPITAVFAALPELYRLAADEPIPAHAYAKSLLFLFVLGGPTLYAYLLFWRGFVRLEEQGLHSRRIWGEHFLPWDEVHKLSFDGIYCQVTGANISIRLSPLMADYSGMVRAIEKRTNLKFEGFPVQSLENNDTKTA